MTKAIIELAITHVGKDLGSKDNYSVFDKTRETFKSLAEAKTWLREKYGSSKKQKMYIDGEDGKPQHCGWIFSFKNKDYSHDSEWWLQQDWVKIYKVERSLISINHD